MGHLDGAFENLRSDAEVASKIACLGLLEERLRSGVPTLRDLSLKCVYTSVHLFYNKPFGDSLANLPNNLMQNLLDLCQSPALSSLTVIANYKDEQLRCKELVTLLLRVPNSNLLSLNILTMTELGLKNCDKFFRLALKNCPRLEHLAAPCPLLPSASSQENLQLAQSIVSGWTKLRSLDLMGFFVTDEIIKLFAEKLPNLQKINLGICRDRFTEEGTIHLLKLHKLTDLELFLQEYTANFPFFAHMLIVLGGGHPSLQRIHFDCYADSQDVHTDSVDLLSYFVPGRKLTLQYVELVRPLRLAWSRNLRVDTLVVHAHAFHTYAGLRNLCNVPCGVSELTLNDCRRPEVVYQLLERIGPQLKRLRLSIDHYCSEQLSGSTVNLFRVMALCPVLEHFATNSLNPLEAGPKYNLSPQNFTNMRSFELNGDCTLLNCGRLEPFFEIFEMVMIGSKHYEVLQLQNSHLLRRTVRFLESNPDCLTQVEVFNGSSFRNEQLKEICSIGKQLMLRSPVLRRIEIHGLDKDQLPDWFVLLASKLGVELECLTRFHCTGHPTLNLMHTFIGTTNCSAFYNDIRSVLGLAKWRKKFFPTVAKLRQVDELCQC